MRCCSKTNQIVTFEGQKSQHIVKPQMLVNLISWPFCNRLWHECPTLKHCRSVPKEWRLCVAMVLLHRVSRITQIWTQMTNGYDFSGLYCTNSFIPFDLIMHQMLREILQISKTFLFKSQSFTIIVAFNKSLSIKCSKSSIEGCGSLSWICQSFSQVIVYAHHNFPEPNLTNWYCSFC